MSFTEKIFVAKFSAKVMYSGKVTHELKATRESMGRDKSLLMKWFVFV